MVTQSVQDLPMSRPGLDAIMSLINVTVFSIPNFSAILRISTLLVGFFQYFSTQFIAISTLNAQARKKPMLHTSTNMHAPVEFN